MVWRNYSFKEAVRRLSIAGAVALAINLPFILWDPHAWLSGILAPVVDPMFPMGDGLISLSFASVLPFFPTWVYSILEVSTMFLCLGWYWRVCKKYPEAAIILAFVPLFFAWRSLPSYFYCSAYPLFVLLTSRGLPKFGGQPRKAVQGHFAYERPVMGNLAGAVGVRAALPFPGMIHSLR
jgi:uncharacterized membrane protein